MCSSDLATLREELKNKGFDFENGRIIYQPLKEDEDLGPVSYPGWADEDEVEASIEIDLNHPILDVEFNTAFGGPHMPRFVAEDKDKIYFPSQYDGNTWICWVYKDISKYVGNKELLPYPGC